MCSNVSLLSYMCIKVKELCPGRWQCLLLRWFYRLRCNKCYLSSQKEVWIWRTNWEKSYSRWKKKVSEVAKALFILHCICATVICNAWISVSAPTSALRYCIQTWGALCCGRKWLVFFSNADMLQWSMNGPLVKLWAWTMQSTRTQMTPYWIYYQYVTFGSLYVLSTDNLILITWGKP